MADIVKYKKINSEENLVNSESNEGSTNGEVAIVLEENHMITNKTKKRSKLYQCCVGDPKECIKRSWIAVLFGIIIFAVALVVSLVITLIVREPKQSVYNSGVAADVPICSEMGGKILEQGGSAVDAAITTMLCVGVVNPESSGIGGGGFMVVYDPVNQSSIAIDFREVAPSLATTNMFHGNENLSVSGGLSVSVPGELAGMKRAHEMFGRLPWKQLFEPVVNLSRDGFKMTEHNEAAVRGEESYFTSDSIFYSWFVNEDGSLKTAGSIIKRVEYSKVLDIIAENGIEEFYNGTIAEEIVEEVQTNGGILTMDDLYSYEPLVSEAISLNITDSLFVTTRLPSSGPILLLILNIMSKLMENNTIVDNKLSEQHLIETFKYSFALRTHLGDPWCEDCDHDGNINIQNKLLSNEFAEYINHLITNNKTFNESHYNSTYYSSDHGTAHISVIGPDGMAVSVTTSVNTYFGSKIITPVSGIVLNDDMDDFSSPNITNAFGLEPSEANFIKPGKRGQSSMCPVIILKRNGEGNLFAKLVSGASGGTRIITSVAQAVVRALFFNQDNTRSVEERRLHHQLLPNILYYEDGYSESILSFLRSIGHVTQTDDSFAVVQQIMVDQNGNVTAHSDSRKNGQSFVTNIINTKTIMKSVK